ncbi:MAG: glycosyltransferase family 2 protein [Nanoarchaeota archaeon]|nr:glycosyltransferase family 2 protein [Nanoarchaeota archaeon]
MVGLQKEFEKVLRRKDMQASYLDGRNLDRYCLPKVSAIIPTYNRSPNIPDDDSNPLGWCLESLLSQRGSSLDEIIVVDDSSSDYTREVVEGFSNSSEIDIRYFRNNRNIGSSKSRNKAVWESNNDLVLFLDDDCIFSPYFVFGAVYTLNSLPTDVAVVHMPVYHRKVSPDLSNSDSFGLLDLESGLITENYDHFPLEYFHDLDSNFLDTRLGVLNPIEIKNLGGIFVSKKGPFLEVGGFPDFLTWRNAYREETILALSLTGKGHKLYFTPDPKFHSVHLKYGARGSEDELRNADGRLRRLISYSNVERENTGNRVDTDEWFFDRIISTYVTLGRHSKNAASRYLRDTEEEFVIENKLSVAGIGGRVQCPDRRREIFDRAIKEGDKLLGELE